MIMIVYKDDKHIYEWRNLGVKIEMILQVLQNIFKTISPFVRHFKRYSLE